MLTNDQVGRPCTHWSLRTVCSISRSSAFISGTVSRRLARTAWWQAMVPSARSKAAVVAALPCSRRSAIMSFSKVAGSMLGSSAGVDRTSSCAGPLRSISRPRLANSPACDSASSASATATWTAIGTSSGCAGKRSDCIEAFSRSYVVRSCAACMSTSTRPPCACARM